MKNSELNRVFFFSVNDGASGSNLIKAEKLLNKVELNTDFEINDLIEFYNIKLYFDNQMFLDNWNENDKTKFQDLVSKLWSKIREFWITIDNTNIVSLFEKLEFRYKEHFWDLISFFQTYKKLIKKYLNQY